jgi:triosephosphate isomerase
MRKLFIAGNWKMNKTISEAVALAKSVATGVAEEAKVDVALIPPFLAIPDVAKVLQDSLLTLGAQNVYFEESGAFTGEVSCRMLSDAGAAFALVGHSERRHVLGETDALIRKKLDALLQANLGAILCVGEQIEEREAGKTKARLNTQVRAGLTGLTALELANVTLAYEPVWAIGTGKTATTDQAQEAHAFIRDLVKELAGDDVARSMRIQYGGSVKPENATELMAQPDVDGALVGGASLKPETFLGIIRAASL